MHSFQATFRVQSAETNWPRLKAINKQVTLTASFNQLSRTAFFIYSKISKAMHLSEEMDWDFFCYHAASFPVLNSCQFNAKHFQLGFKRSVEIHWLPKWIVNGIGYWKRAVLLLPLAISHNFKIGLLVNGILRCQCFLAGLGFFFFYFFCLAFPFHTEALLCGPSLTSLLLHQELDVQTGAGSAHSLSPARSHVRMVPCRAQAHRLWFLQELISLAWGLWWLLLFFWSAETMNWSSCPQTWEAETVQ